MFEKAAELLKMVGTHIAGLAFISGLIFGFLGFFDIADFKSISLRIPPAWYPVVAGVLLAAIGLALHLLWPRVRQMNPDIQQSPGSIYVLRHMDAISNYQRSSDFGYQIYAFNTSNPKREEYRVQQAGWEKASDYLVRALVIRGLVDNEGSDYIISDAGKKYVKADSVQAKYKDSFVKPILWPNSDA